jgi:hypothetical protein
MESQQKKTSGKLLDFDKIMIRLLYKIIHFEGDVDHSKNIGNTFLFIWIVLSSLSLAFVYLIFTILELRNGVLDYALLATGLFASIVLYYLIRIKQAKSFVEKGWDRDFFDFGKSNRFLKPLVVLLIFTFITVLFKGILIIVR